MITKFPKFQYLQVFQFLSMFQFLFSPSFNNICLPSKIYMHVTDARQFMISKFPIFNFSKFFQISLQVSIFNYLPSFKIVFSPRFQFLSLSDFRCLKDHLSYKLISESFLHIMNYLKKKCTRMTLVKPINQ